MIYGGEQLAAQRQQGGAAPVGKEPEMPDAHKSARQHVQKKAAQKFLDRQAHQALLVLVGRVAPTESDVALCQRNQSMIRNRYAMRVAAQIAQGVFRPAERALGIDHPIGAEQWAEPRGRMPEVPADAPAIREIRACLRRGVRASPPQTCRGRRGSGLSRAAGRNDTVNMGMMQQLLIPGMQHAEESDLRSQVLGIAGDLE